MTGKDYEVSYEEMASLVKTLDEIINEGDEPDFYGILKECAWNILHENPGTEFGVWVTMLMEQYPAEVVDAIGSHPAETYASLADMWDCDDYRDPDTDMCHNFAEWAEYFATDRSVELFDHLAEAKRDIKRFEALQTQNQPNPQPRAQSPAEGHF